ncbi:unnamed protein product [Microthlaspi erraticum]|uniref:BRCT domain-containing protein n=1 Tax=Microthlaspi erraticum TaxID=1685480 RepID=A0A6D2J829_9BRAS|nr:unnamed protein product [Microthlaspi erraticum]
MAKVDNNFSPLPETQPIDSLPSSPSHSGEDKDAWIRNHDDELIQDTAPFEDDAWINDEYLETQVIDTECDNEEVLLCDETQCVSEYLETQVIETECDNEEFLLCDETQPFTMGFETQEEPLVDNTNLLTSEDNRQHANEKVESTGALDAGSNKDGISGGKVATFTSLRTAAFRASAMAARAATQKLLSSDCSALLSCHSSGQGVKHNVGEVGDKQCLPSPVERKNELRKGNRTARKLFLDDPTEEEECPYVPLSYFDSQEPGEASQASALNFVDKLISESRVEFALDVEPDCGRRREEKSKCVASVKGPQELAKKVSYQARAVGNAVFDWDDSREDEGGGDIYRRRKEEFFGVGSKAREPLTLPREQKRELIHESHKRLGVAVAHSDSRLLQQSMTRSRKTIQATKKNLGKELDAAVSEESNDKAFEIRDLVALGYDTQVAAEAVDALRSGDRSKLDAAEASSLTGKNLSPGEERGFSNGVTRQSKGTKRIQAMGKDELVRRRMKKASPSPAKACRKNIERSSKSDQLDKEVTCSLKRKKVQTASRESKKNLVDKLDGDSKESNSRMFDRREEVEAGPDTQMAAEVINALHFGDDREIGSEPNWLTGKRPSPEEGISGRGVATRKSKRKKGIQAVDNDVELLKPKAKKTRSTLSKACEKNAKLDTPDEVVVSKLLKQSSRCEAELLSDPKRRRSARISQDVVNEAERISDSAYDTPVKSKAPSKIVSPICMGDEYHRLSCKDSRKSKTTREFRSLTSPLEEPVLEKRSTRKRRDLSSIRVLFSQHLDEEVTEHLKKILAKFAISEASTMTEATHFIANTFMRTRNMLEAIASGKPVVTTQWLESIDQVNIYVDEELYILRDSKKEKEFGFNMGVSLARARQFPLLQGRRVFITPNTKPGLTTITTLVKAVHGRPVERLGRSTLSEDKVPENLLVLSCEEDRDISIPFLERGAEVYSSELLLNGIVTQKLEYERYRLFADNVRKTRSTIWIKDGKGVETFVTDMPNQKVVVKGKIDPKKLLKKLKKKTGKRVKIVVNEERDEESSKDDSVLEIDMELICLRDESVFGYNDREFEKFMWFNDENPKAICCIS